MDLELIKILATSAFGGGVVSFVLKNWFDTRLKNSIKHEYDAKLLELKNRFEKDNATLSAIENHYRTTNAKGHEMVLNSIDLLWKGLIEIRCNRPSLLTLVNVLYEKEFGEYFGNKKIKNYPEITDDDIGCIYGGNVARIQQNRLFAGEKLWLYFSSYQKLLARISIVVKRGREEKNVPLWWEDRICLEIISDLCNEEERSEFASLELEKITWLQSHIEQKFLLHANRIISGESSIDSALEQSVRITKKYGANEIREGVL
ncbi:hypothetical protein [Pseudoalteromonas luteoviolacea]|uniref:hypothetical protein n=1 Tax=Pseudoalteromonas luteoviolacea TaxID=43657 RepID=UPI001B35C30B|nr:hypothetical protein [Pseudoalteromonas luteoviolacea]MBQ4840155.1 hypothetical protein [Pseudoalteromonas luteoviolacea]